MLLLLVVVVVVRGGRLPGDESWVLEDSAPHQFRAAPVAERAERCVLRHMRTGELEHVNFETKHSSTQQKTRPHGLG